MAKKLSLLLAAVAVLAVAVPAMANATVPTLRGKVTHTPISVTGSPVIRGTGTNVIITSEQLGEIKCSTLTLEGKLTVNDMTNGITGSNTGQVSPPTTDCTNGTNTVIVEEVKLTDLKSTVGGVVTASFTSKVKVGTRKCEFNGTSVTGSYVTGGTSLVFTKAAGVVGVPEACGEGTLDGSFELELVSTGEKLEGFF